MSRSFAARTLQLANLAPDIVKAIWENRHPVSLTLEKLRRGIPDSWEEQRKLLIAPENSNGKFLLPVYDLNLNKEKK